MTNEEHIIAWIENDCASYDKLLHLSIPGNFISERSRFDHATELINRAVRQACIDGDMHRSNVTAQSMAKAALLALQWKVEE